MESFDWDSVSTIIADILDGVDKDKSVKEIASNMDKIIEMLKTKDENGKNYVSLLFQNSILSLLEKENLSPTLVEKILICIKIILTNKLHLYFEQNTLEVMICQLLDTVFKEKYELFEEIGNLGLEILEMNLPEIVPTDECAFILSICLNYATKSTLVHGQNSLLVINKVVKQMEKQVRLVLPGVSVAMTAIIQTKGTRHQVLCLAFETLVDAWSNVEMTDDDEPKIGELISRIFSTTLEHWKARIARIKLANVVITYHKEKLKNHLSPCIRCLFAGVADEHEKVREFCAPYLVNISGDVIISGEFEQCVEDLTKIAKRADAEKRQQLLQTISGIIAVNKDQNNDFTSQIETSLSSLATALIFVSEIQIEDLKLCEINGGFIVRRRPFLDNEVMFRSFTQIVLNLPTDDFVEVLIDILGQSSVYAPEIFYMFGLLKDQADPDLIISVLEEPQWWSPKDQNPKSVQALEIALEVISMYCNSEILQNVLSRIIECLSSPYPSVEQTAHAALQRIAPEGNISKLFMDNVDYITDRLLARLQFIDVHPEILTVFSAVLSVDGDISDLLTHIVPRIFEILDTKDNLSLPILRMLSRVAVKLPSACDDIIDRSIHFILSPSLNQQCAALDAIIAALPQIKDEEKLLPMVHQMWAPSILILQSAVESLNPAARRCVLLSKTALIVARDFVRQRVGEQLPLYTKLLNSALDKLADNKHHENALNMAITVLQFYSFSYEGLVVFGGRELEMFTSLLQCLGNEINEDIKKEAINVLWKLYQASKPFIWSLMLEVSQTYPQREDLPLKPTNFFPRISKDIRNVIKKLLYPQSQES